MVISYYDVINFKENKELFSVLHFIFLKINSLFSLISIAQRELLKTKNGKSIQMNQFSVRVIATGFEPVTYSLEVSCSIQLSYATIEI